MGKFKFGKNTVKNIQTVNPILQELAARAIEISEVDFGVIKNGGLRTAEMQNELFKRGASQLDGYEKVSYHQSGLAIDFVLYKDGKYNWSDIEGYKKINKAVNKVWDDLPYKEDYILTWGGNWESFRDYPHYEIRENWFSM